MITDQYTRKIQDISWAEQEVDIVTAKLLLMQRRIASTYYVRRTGNLINSLNPSAATSSLSDPENIILSISYPLSIRFNDRKRKRQKTVKVGSQRFKVKHKRGNTFKKNHTPIYNKYVYGFLLKGLYRRLHDRLETDITDQISSCIQNFKFF